MKRRAEHQPTVVGDLRLIRLQALRVRRVDLEELCCVRRAPWAVCPWSGCTPRHDTETFDWFEFHPGEGAVHEGKRHAPRFRANKEVARERTAELMEGQPSDPRRGRDSSELT